MFDELPVEFVGPGVDGGVHVPDSDAANISAPEMWMVALLFAPFFYDQGDLGIGDLVEMPLQALKFVCDIVP